MDEHRERAVIGTPTVSENATNTVLPKVDKIDKLCLIRDGQAAGDPKGHKQTRRKTMEPATIEHTTNGDVVVPRACITEINDCKL